MLFAGTQTKSTARKRDTHLCVCTSAAHPGQSATLLAHW